MLRRDWVISRVTLNRSFVSKTAEGTQIVKGSLNILGNINVAGTVSGPSVIASRLATARSIGMTGDGSWAVEFDGSGNVTGAMTLSNSGVTAGTWTKVTVDAKGRVTSGANLTANDVPTLPLSKVTGAAPLESPTFTGTPRVPTAAQATNDTQAASTAFVKAAIDALINGAPGALDTLQELANAMGNDPNFATTVTNSLATKAPINNPTFTGIASTPTLHATNVDGRNIVAATWGDFSSNNNGQVLLANNAYTVGAGVWRYSTTHATMGARGIRLSVGGGIEMFDTGSVATTANAAFTPVWVKIGSVNDLDDHKLDPAPHQYGGRFEWRYNQATDSLDLVVV